MINIFQYFLQIMKVVVFVKNKQFYSVHCFIWLIIGITGLCVLFITVWQSLTQFGC